MPRTPFPYNLLIRDGILKFPSFISDIWQLWRKVPWEIPKYFIYLLQTTRPSNRDSFLNVGHNKRKVNYWLIENHIFKRQGMIEVTHCND